MGSIRGFEDGLFAMRNATRVRFLDCAFEIDLARSTCSRRQYRNLTFCVKQAMKSVDRDVLRELQRECERRICHLDESRHNELRQHFEYVNRVNAVKSQVYRHWFLEWCLDSKAAARALLWPYPDSEKQLHWLKAGLDCVDGANRQFFSDQAREMVGFWKEHDEYLPLEAIQRQRGDVFAINKVWNAKEEWRMETDIYWEGRKLDLLDCVFFAARLHHRIVQHRLDVSLPPYALACDFPIYI